MSDQLDPVLAAKWVAGELSADDRRALDEWLAADPAHAAQLEELRQLWSMAGDAAEARAATPDPAEAARWAAVVRGIRAGETAGSPPPVRRPGPVRAMTFPSVERRSRTWLWASAAAAAVLVAVGGGMWLGADRDRSQVAEAPGPMRVRETARGERADFRLIDGTRVMLNVASRIRVPADFGERNRTVYLEGSAYFDVVHDDGRPFAVHAADIVAKDLGTEFVVRAYPEDAHASVVVRTGKVVLRGVGASDTSAQGLLGPGQIGRLDADGRPLVRRADLAAHFAWTTGTLVIDGTPLRDALPELSRWFDLDFRLADSSLGEIPLAATLTNQPTDEALSFLAASLGLRQVRQGRVVAFYPAKPRR